MKTGRPRTCECGTCGKCTRREKARLRYQALSLEERRAIIAARDPEKVRAADRARYYRNPEPRRERMKEWVEKNRERSTQLKEEWAARNPEKRHAEITLNNAVRDGKVQRQPCEVCGNKAQAHHDDYSKPLDVRWFCHKHHAELHRRYPVET